MSIRITCPDSCPGGRRRFRSDLNRGVLNAVSVVQDSLLSSTEAGAIASRPAAHRERAQRVVVEQRNFNVRVHTIEIGRIPDEAEVRYDYVHLRYVYPVEQT